MAKKKLNLDEIMDEIHTVAELSLNLTGQEILGLAKLVRYVLTHPEQFDDEESRASGTTSDIVNIAGLLSLVLVDQGFGYGEGDSEDE
jgi:hypothetical protein